MAEERQRGRTLRVLVVDDDADTADTLATLLELHGHEVRAATSGEAALCAAGDRWPEVVLLDLVMPGMDGCEVARRLQGIRAGRPLAVIAVTGDSWPEARRRAATPDVDACLRKPTNTDLLLALMDYHCGPAN